MSARILGRSSSSGVRGGGFGVGPAQGGRGLGIGKVFSEDGTLVAAGGRVLNATGRGATLAEARDRAYALTEAVDWPEGFCRRDIGWRAL